MNRLDKIKQEFLEQFTNKLKEEKVDISIESAFDILISADPSRNKKNVRWLMETYLNDGFLFEDISSGEHSKVHETLNVFIRNKNKLDILDRSINRYQSIADMWKIVKQYAEDKTGKEVKREEHDKAMSESELVVDNDDIRVVVPLTEYASKFHGRGTRWCTGADNDNRFWYYAKDAPLFVITLKDSGKKLQLWKNGDDIQFMDADDKEVSKEYIEQNWIQLRHILQFCGLLLQYVPDEYKTYELCKLACEQNGWALKYTPEHFKTPELCKIAVKNCHQSLKMVPEKFITPELCELAVKHNGYALYYVPDKFKTQELCELAVKLHGYALAYVPDKFKTPELYKMAVKKDGEALTYIPDESVTLELCELAIKQKGLALEYVPNKFKTYELCKLACEQNGLALEFVSDEYKTRELCKIAVENNGYAFKSVPSLIRTYEMCQMAVEQQLKEFSIPTDIYKQEIDKLKEMLNMPSIEPSQTMHHIM